MLAYLLLVFQPFWFYHADKEIDAAERLIHATVVGVNDKQTQVKATAMPTAAATDNRKVKG